MEPKQTTDRSPVDESAETARPSDEGRRGAHPLRGLAFYFLVGVALGVLFIKSEVVSWFRIQEMFRFGGIHMYGILGSAVAVAAGSVALLKRLGVRSLGGEEIELPPKKLGSGTRYWAGGLLFGLGWGLTGACPGPIFALLGNGIPVFGVVLLSAVAGMWTYGTLRPRLPHY